MDGNDFCVLCNTDIGNEFIFMATKCVLYEKYNLLLMLLYESYWNIYNVLIEFHEMKTGI